LFFFFGRTNRFSLARAISAGTRNNSLRSNCLDALGILFADRATVALVLDVQLVTDIQNVFVV
jgi:hypothetical protein